MALVARVPGREVAVQVAEGGLEQMLDNLIANAIDHSPSGSTVTTSVADDGGHVEVAVADEGAGLSEAQLTRMFDRF